MVSGHSFSPYGNRGDFTQFYAGRLNGCGRTSPNSRCSNTKPALLVARFGLTSPPLASEYNKTFSSGASTSSGVSYSQW